MSSFCGADLKRIRLSKGIDLCHIAGKTRISKRYIEDIENDNYKSLPAVVYLKGYLEQYASYLGLDGKEVVKGYLGHFMDWIKKHKKLSDTELREYGLVNEPVCL